MTRLKISDLSFCEVAAEKDIEVKGGIISALPEDERVLSLVKRFLTVASVDLSSVKVGQVSPEDTVDKIETEIPGVSGFQMTSKDGKRNTTVITGPGLSMVSASIVSPS